MSKDKVRYAVIGAGNIAQVAVLPAFAHAKSNSQLVALVSGDAEKRRELGRRYDLEVMGGYEDLESVIEQGRVDAVYVATPNSLHREHALRAAAAGAHVLCEKPLAGSTAEGEAIVRGCREAGVKLMVAYRLHFEEATLEAIELVRSGKLGEPRLFSSMFTHVVRPGDIREDASLRGGALLDLGVYCVNAARNLFGEEPTWVMGTTEKRDGVDDTASAMLRFPSGATALLSVSNRVARTSSYRIAGTDGDLYVEPGYEYTEELVHHLTIDGKTKTKRFGKRDQFAPELEHFSRCILEDRQPEPNGEEGLLDLRVIDAAIASAETGRPVELEPRLRSTRPSLEQEQKKPAVSKPPTVNAPSPSLK